jgi:hypothetical protein
MMEQIIAIGLVAVAVITAVLAWRGDLLFAI